MKDYDDNDDLEEQEEGEEQDYGEVEVDQEEEDYQNEKFKKFAEIAKHDNKMKVKAVSNAHHDFEVDPNQSLEESKEEGQKLSQENTKKGVINS